MTLCYKCHTYREFSSFYATPDDPLAQVCANCKTVKEQHDPTPK